MEPFQFFGFLWLIRTTKIALFYLYFWQLKEYHIGRFLAHFDTYYGKKLIFNPVNILKIILLLVFPIVPLLTFFGTAVIYLLEFPKVFFDFIGKKIKKPVLTKKTASLFFATFIFEAGLIFLAFASIGFWEKFKIFSDSSRIVIFVFWLLVFDVFSPVIFSIIVLFFQPFTVLMRNRIIKKAKEKRQKFPNLLVVGITGSYGKTSTKEFLYSILKEKFGDKVLKTKEHQNSEVGISQCILNDLNKDHEIFIVEMGAYNVGGIKLLCDITGPKIGILTGINEQHMATFGSQENIIKAKYELIESLPKNGIAFFNGKNKYCVELYEKTLRRGSGRVFLYGENARFFGEENILGAMAMARELGMQENEIQNAVGKIDNKMPGIQIKEGIGGLKIIDATYSANPDGVIANLEYLRQFNGKKIIVMPCLIELGKASKEVHRRIGQKIGEVCDLAIITTKDYFREISDVAGEKTVFMDNPKKIFDKIKSFTKDGDIVLLESRVPKKLIERLMIIN
ncbi:MAG: Mur ligase family protein [Parcubacteria group bacterium]